MIRRIDVGPVAICAMPIEAGAGANRRRRETAAVDAILRSMGVDPAAVVRDDRGAPSLQGWSISITHSQALAAVALAPAGMRIGIDAEEWRPALRRVAPKFLTEDERCRLAAAAAADRDAELLRLWTIKEAVYKAALTPGLPFTAIAAGPAGALGLADAQLLAGPAGAEQGWATADGRAYSLAVMSLPPSVLTLAICVSGC